MIKTVIIDDEIHSRNLLMNMIANYCTGVSVVGMATDVLTGINAIREHQPDLVFLDVEMPGGDGFSILNAFDKINFKIIFVSGYDHYAIKAFKYAALDYILKPVALNDLNNAIQRAKMVIGNQIENVRLLYEQLNEPTLNPQKILIPIQGGHLTIQWEEIVKLEANGSYVYFYLTNGNKYLVGYPISYYEELLPPGLFFRIHKSFIINCQKVTSIEGGRGGSVFLEDGSYLKIAARRKKAFLDFYKKMK